MGLGNDWLFEWRFLDPFPKKIRATEHESYIYRGQFLQVFTGIYKYVMVRCCIILKEIGSSHESHCRVAAKAGFIWSQILLFSGTKNVEGDMYPGLVRLLALLQVLGQHFCSHADVLGGVLAVLFKVLLALVLLLLALIGAIRFAKILRHWCGMSWAFQR